MNLDDKKTRYLRDPWQIRLGGLAANLARVKSFSRNEANNQAVFDLFEESKYFIEWTARDLEIGVAAELAELQLQIALWQRELTRHWATADTREQLGQASARWSQHLLVRSGLIDEQEVTQ